MEFPPSPHWCAGAYFIFSHAIEAISPGASHATCAGSPFATATLFTYSARTPHRWLADAQPVRYRSQRPFVSPLAPTGQKESAWLLQKGREWAYEREWRMVRDLASADRITGVGTASVHLFAVPRRSVVGVILGARMPPAQRAELLVHLKLSGNRHIRIVEARLSPRRFALEFVDLARSRRQPATDRRPQGGGA